MYHPYRHLRYPCIKLLTHYCIPAGCALLARRCITISERHQHIIGVSREVARNLLLILAFVID